MPNDPVPDSSPAFLRNHAVISYFLLTYAISWCGAFLIVLPHLYRHEAVPQFAGLMIFPAMLVGPAFSGLLLTRMLGGKAGLRDLFLRMRRLRFSARWFAVVLIPPALILAVLLALSSLISPIFAPNHFWIGFSFGLLAAFLEEIGWMGYAFPKMRRVRNSLGPAILLGLLWSLWHLPAINFLGAATPHGAYWLPYFLAFAAVMTPMRLIICWSYVNTQSVALSQLLHASSTGFLVVLSPARATPAQEVHWYLVYAAALWVVAGIIAISSGKTLTTRAGEPA